MSPDKAMIVVLLLLQYISMQFDLLIVWLGLCHDLLGKIRSLHWCLSASSLLKFVAIVSLPRC